LVSQSASGAAWDAISKVHSYHHLSFAEFMRISVRKSLALNHLKCLAERFVTFLAKYRDEFGKELPELDLGGGYGIAYLEGEESVDPHCNGYAGASECSKKALR